MTAQSRVQDAREAPGRIVPHQQAHVCPRRLSASAWSSACSTTAPQNDQEYGTTIPTFTRQSCRLANVARRSAPPTL